ncbi:sigma-54 interaction domain-containing protein [Hafnia paralvei]|uniref:sigma-54 interaction domain-containing protein n=1 Tax=Hafnia paralvei TaxID=546367 RepID=UPI003CEC40C3
MPTYNSPRPIEVIGQSASFQKLLRMVERVAPTHQTLLLNGPTGSGKEVIAQLIHQLSVDPHAPFIDLNCGAFPEHLVEAELFGHTKGAFTGAQNDRMGHLEMVRKGTLFLDEIGEMPLAIQAKLLRVLESKTFRPLGGSEVRHFKGRIVAATHRDLFAQVKAGSFREDLYYRLNVIVLELPRLSQRVEDIPVLVDHFSSSHPQPLSFSREAIAYLQRYAWPGNIRELRNLIERLSTLSDSPHISVEQLHSFLPISHTEVKVSSDLLADAMLALPAKDKLAAAEQIMIERALERTSGNKTAAASLLGISRKAVERRLQLRAERRPSAVRYLLKGQSLVQQNSYLAAIQSLNDGIVLLDGIAMDDEIRALHYSFYRLLAVSFQNLYGWLNPHAVENHRMAVALGKKLGDEVELICLQFWSWPARLASMELQAVRTLSQELLQLGLTEKTTYIWEEAHLAMASARFWAGDYSETLIVLERGQLLGERQVLHDTPGMDLMGQALTLEGLAAFQCGDFRRSGMALSQLLKRANSPHSEVLQRVVSLLGIVWLTFLFEDFQQTKIFSAELVTLAQAYQLKFYYGLGKLFYHYVTQDQGDVGKDIDECYQTYLSTDGGCLYHTLYIWLRGEIFLANHRPAECLLLIVQTLPVLSQGQGRAFISELFELQARAKAVLDGNLLAESAYRQAISTAELLGALPAQINASVSLNRILIALGQPPETASLRLKMQNAVGGEKDAKLLVRAQQILDQY